MNEATQPAIEPVTERDIDEVLNARAAGYDIRYALEQDRRRVAERVAGRTAEMAEWVGIAAEIERLRAEVAAHRKHDVLRCDALMKAEAEVARLTAACAAKDGVIIRFLNAPLAQRDGTPVPSLLLASARAALSDTAGANMIDASGAVETSVFWYNGRYVVELPESMALTRVLIVPVNP